VLPDDHFCEACGATLTGAPAAAPPGATSSGAIPIAPATAPAAAPAPAGAPAAAWRNDSPLAVPTGPPPSLTCPKCAASATEVGPDGLCARCGHRWSPLRAHDEIAEGPVAAVTDRGLHHWRNEDAVGIHRVEGIAGRPGGFAMVVCDGVSVSQEPHLVSQAAAEAALHVLTAALTAGGPLDVAMVDATAAAQQAAAARPYDPRLEVGPGACTLVAAAVRGRQAAFASVGDSRAYWVDAEGALQIGNDDSLAGALVASGRFTVEEAMASAGAHALTKWLGVDSTDAAPTVTNVELTGPGMIILASDGLWNYAPDPDHLAQLIGPVGAESALDLARRLADFAVQSGGADNITVAIGRHELDPLPAAAPVAAPTAAAAPAAAPAPAPAYGQAYGHDAGGAYHASPFGRDFGQEEVR
jgi:serine/threonine protein phosphatase PrpC